MKNRIGIITVVYNNAGTILDALQSVSSQQEIEVEHVIIDGGSTDGTLEIIRNCAHIPTVLVSEPDRGIYDAMNKGLLFVTCDIVGFLNSDDVYFDQKALKRVQAAFDTDSTIQIVYGDLVYVHKHNLSQVVRTWKSKPYYEYFFEDGNVPPHPAFFVKRALIIKDGGFDLKFTLAADYELMFRLLKIQNNTSLYLSKTLVKMRLGGKTNQSLKNIIKGNREIIRTWSKHSVSIPLRFWIKRYSFKILQFATAFWRRL